MLWEIAVCASYFPFFVNIVFCSYKTYVNYRTYKGSFIWWALMCENIWLWKLSKKCLLRHMVSIFVTLGATAESTWSICLQSGFWLTLVDFKTPDPVDLLISLSYTWNCSTQLSKSYLQNKYKIYMKYCIQNYNFA